MDELLSVKEASLDFKISKDAIYNAIRIGRLNFYKITRVGIRLEQKDIVAWINCYKVKRNNFAEILPKFDLSLENYDKIFLKRRTELKGQITWTYGIGSVILRKTKNKEERFYIHYQIDKHRVRKVVKGARTKADALKALNSEIADALRGEYNFKKQDSEITFHDMADIYLEKYAKPNKRS